jgi:hypothetical protein
MEEEEEMVTMRDVLDLCFAQRKGFVSYLTRRGYPAR